ncbi:MAG: cytochrome c3 family protein [Myxococcota bacterium]
MRTPTDVAWAGELLVVADPAAGTVTAVDADGAPAWTSDAVPHPMGLCGDPLWVGGEGTAARLGDGGAVVQRIALPAGLHPSDVAPAGDGVWVSAAPDGVVLQLGPDGAERLRVALDAPRGLAADDAGGVWVAEAGTGRLVHLDPAGAVAGEAGGWGLGAGQFVAPKGLARTAEGLAVADSHQGVVVLLDPRGGFRRLVADPDGAWTFVHPLGVAQRGDRLAVADAGAGRVVVLRAGGEAADGGAWPGTEWLFRPSTTADPDPSTTCRQCHDGTRSVDLGVWDPGARQHPTAPGPRAQVSRSGRAARARVPADVRVGADGGLRCTSCHALHARPEPEVPGVVRGAELAAVDAGPVAVSCVDCHADALSRGGTQEGHPVGVVPPAGADLPLHDGRIDCSTCHAVHGAAFDGLLVRRADDGTLCLTCHADHAPGSSRHPIGVRAPERARTAIAALGGTLGPDATLTCLSCHDPHGARDRHLLRARGTQSACTGCHDPTAGPHAERPCAGCHGMHHAPPDTDGTVACSGCHEASTAHPTDCTGCHAPHDPTPADCVGCHAAQRGVLGGPHDAAVQPVAGATGTCTSCHDPHDTAPGRYLLPATAGDPATGRCLRCHDGSTRATAVARWVHPVPTLPVSQRTGPFTGPDGEPVPPGRVGAVTCRTCHDSHTGALVPDVVPLCAACHGDDAQRNYADFHGRAGEAP